MEKYISIKMDITTLLTKKNVEAEVKRTQSLQSVMNLVQDMYAMEKIDDAAFCLLRDCLHEEALTQDPT